jgi:hypothetical protein
MKGAPGVGRFLSEGTMRRFVLAFAVLALPSLPLFVSSPARADKAAITAARKGHDLEVVVHGVTDYCSTDAATQVLRTADTIRIVRERPHRVSRCFSSRDLTFTIAGVDPGTYTISYEQVPLVAPARALRVAWTTAFVRE